MKQHRILSIIIFIVLAFVLYKLGQSFLRDNKTGTANENIKQENLIVDISFVNEVPLKTESKYGSVSGTYPQFRNADPSFNDKIRNAVIIAQSEFENNAKENWKSRYDTRAPGEKVNEFPDAGDMTFIIKTDYIQVNSNKISFLITVAGYSGGAHGYESLISFNYDVKTAKDITLDQIFPNDKDYLKTIASYSRANLKDQFLAKTKRADFDNDADYKSTLENIDSMLIPGTEPTTDNFSVFTILPDTLNIYFSQYQVAAYVYGSQMVKMPLQ